MVMPTCIVSCERGRSLIGCRSNARSTAGHSRATAVVSVLSNSRLLVDAAALGGEAIAAMTDHPLLNHAKGRQPDAAFTLPSLSCVASWRRAEVNLLPPAATASGFPRAAPIAAAL